jgi:ATP-dependent protease ClpP protease subunit
VQDSARPITITINSPGGSVMDGLALYDKILRLRRKGTPIETRATGLVASMATILLQAGDVRWPIRTCRSWCTS